MEQQQSPPSYLHAALLALESQYPLPITQREALHLPAGLTVGRGDGALLGRLVTGTRVGRRLLDGGTGFKEVGLKEGELLVGTAVGASVTGAKVGIAEIVGAAVGDVGALVGFCVGKLVRPGCRQL